MKLIRRSYFLFFIISIIVFNSVEISPSTFWLAGVLSFAILPCLILNISYAFYFLLRKHYKWLFFSIILFSISYKHLKRTIVVNPNQEIGGIKVLNSNVRIFNVYRHLRNENSESSKKMINWISNNDADIMILQEYYNLDTSSIWSTTKAIQLKFPFNFLQVSLYNRLNSEFGQIIYSKHPIIKKGLIPYDNKTFNQAIFADIVKGKDTLRVYNVHLESMKIEERKIFDNQNSENEIKEKVKDTSHKLIRGFKIRTKQIERIVDHIKSSPYPVILGADMNDTPYSYSYNEFSKLLNNSFEEKGNGFDFTFNGKLFFLRIDNLFVSDDFSTNSFTVHREIPYSDHFPISATYTLKQ